MPRITQRQGAESNLLLVYQIPCEQARGRRSRKGKKSGRSRVESVAEWQAGRHRDSRGKDPESQSFGVLAGLRRTKRDNPIGD